MMINALVDAIWNFTELSPHNVIVDITSTSFDIVPFLPPLIAAGIGGGIAWLIHRSQKKQERVNSMLGVFKILNSPIHRLARETVYCAYRLYTEGDLEIFEREPYHSTASMVRADMDQMGLLIDDGLLDEVMFLKAYWNTVLVSWKALEENINQERSKRTGYKSYMKNFQELKDKARRFRDDNGLGSGEPDVYQDRDCGAKFNGIKR